jgi:anti-sigma B factor antagonist
VSESADSGFLLLKLEGAGEVIRVRIRGDLDFSSAGRLERMLDRLGDLRGHTLVLDFSRVRHVDSTGLTAIVAVKLRGDREGFELFVEGVPRNVQRTLQVTGLDRLLALAPDWLSS